MDNQIYLIAQLLTPRFDEPPDMSLDGFLEEADKWVDSRTSELMREIAANGTVTTSGLPSSLDDLVEFERELRAELGAWRQARRDGREYQPRRFDSNLLDEGTPLELERKIMRLRWDFFDDLESEHHFDVERVILFLGKLIIQHRLHAFDAEVGQSVFRDATQVQVFS